LNEIAALDVAMHDAAAVSLVERIGHLRRDVDRFADRYGPAQDTIR